MNLLSEQELVTLAKDGDEAAFEQLINLSLSKLRALLIHTYKLQSADLEDIIQIATIKVFKKISTFRNESAFTTWFYIVLRNEAINCLRTRNLINKHEVHVSLPDEESQDYEHMTVDAVYEETAATMLEKKEALIAYRQMIEQVLNELTDEHRAVLNMSLQEELTYQQIAEQLKIPIGTVMSRLFFARKHAQKLILEYVNKHDIQLDCLGKN